MRAERLDEDHAMLWGASYPGMSRLYESVSYTHLTLPTTHIV